MVAGKIEWDDLRAEENSHPHHRRTAVDYLRRARRAGLAWPLPEGLSDEALERLLFAPPPVLSPDRRALPDWPLLQSAYGLYQPRDLATASHSIPYFVARAMVAGKIEWDDLAPKRILDPAIQGLQDKVEIVEDAALDPYDYPGGATVVVTTAEGTRLTATVDHAPGTPERGCSGEDIEAKYRELAPRAGLSTDNPQAGAQIEESLSAFKGLEDIPDICSLMPSLVAGNPGARRGEN